MVLNQPLYAAISTSPLILVPCSYVAGAGGISPGLIPAGNIVIPNPQSSSPEPQKSVIPTFTVMSGVTEESGTTSAAEGASSPPKSEVSKGPKDPPKTPKQESVESPGLSKEEATEMPLDLSFRKRENDGNKRTSPLSQTDSGTVKRFQIL